MSKDVHTLVQEILQLNTDQIERGYPSEFTKQLRVETGGTIYYYPAVQLLLCRGYEDRFNDSFWLTSDGKLLQLTRYASDATLLVEYQLGQEGCMLPPRAVIGELKNLTSWLQPVPCP